MKRTTGFTALAAGLLTVSLGAGPAQAAPRYHVDEVANVLMQQARAFSAEIERYCSGTPQYEHLAADAREMYERAHHIHEVAHYDGSRRHIRKDTKKLDKLFHHVEELLDEMEYELSHRSHRSHYDGHGAHFSRGGFRISFGSGRVRYGFGGYGDYRLAHVNRMQRRMKYMGDTLHHLLDDVRPRRGHH